MKYMQLLLIGPPGVGKSTFAAHAPKPFFITTDANYQYLDIYGAKDEDHVQVHNWVEWLIEVDNLVKNKDGKYDKYETIVVDLVEDLYKWNEEDYCKMNNIQYVGDEDYGKGWRITQDRFFIEMARVLSVNKNVILLSHAYTTTARDRKGLKDVTKYWPSNKVPDKVWDSITGRVRYALHCFVEDEVIDERVVKHRYLSLIPKSGEFGVTRGLDENNTPPEIPLDWQTFANIIGLGKPTPTVAKAEEPKLEKMPNLEPEVKQEPVVEKPAEQKQEPTIEVKDIDFERVEEQKIAASNAQETKSEPVVEEKPVEVKPADEPKQEVKDEKPATDKNAKLADLMARLGLGK